MNLYGFFYGDHKHRVRSDNNPHGPMLLLSVLRWHAGRLVGINLLFVVSCLPVVTIPCALTAMSKVLGLMLERRICYPLYHFRKAFADQWRRSLPAGWSLLAVLAAAMLGVWFYPRSGLPLAPILGALCLVIALLLLSASIYLFPMIAFTDLGVGALLANAIRLALLCLPMTVLVLFVDAGILAVCYLGLPYTVPVMPVIGFVLMGLVGNMAGWAAMKRYVLVKNE
ncbi:DUF624 domain-containing protein [Bifidobacterium apicola]|uniref:DUF624 domain-containing protein n=1 Tax=Bifidobacterium apicola TaxID=3230739 RepID=UPI0036F20F00